MYTSHVRLAHEFWSTKKIIIDKIIISDSDQQAFISNRLYYIYYKSKQHSLLRFLHTKMTLRQSQNEVWYFSIDLQA